jgi:hypothetical protein
VCTVTVNVNHAPEGLQPIPNLREVERAIKRAQKAAGRPRCKRCGWSRAGNDRGFIRRSMCTTCEIGWLDRIVHRLIKRVGRKAAIAALKALAPK